MKISKQQIQASQFAYRFLETDGSGGFISQTATSANVRNDDSLYTRSLKAPIKRYKYIQKFDEVITIDDNSYNLSSQTYVNDKRNTDSRNYVLEFKVFKDIEIIYQVEDVTISKRIIFSNQSAQVAIEYKVQNPFGRNINYKLVPQIAGHSLGQYKAKEQYDYQVKSTEDVTSFESDTEQNVYIKSNLQFTVDEPKFTGDYYYPHDTRDGRDGIGSSTSYGHYIHSCSNTYSSFEFILSDSPRFEYTVEQLFEIEINRKQDIIDNSNGTTLFANRLALATDSYLVDRDSTSEKTIIAGYPFFGDWGRDTFWAFNGTCLQTKRYKEAKSILRSFAPYEKNGLIPNMFPEGDEYPFYNSVDAPLLYINSVYEYYLATNDIEFVLELKPVIENMINNYIKGTDYHIKMEADGLISSGAGLEQLTWMDVRFEQILPTPRQGKCVEINSMWYNALMIINQFNNEIEEPFAINEDVQLLAEKVRTSFRKSFIKNDGYLRDVISGTSADDQIRSNAIWAITQNFSPLELSEMKAVIKIASKHLYTSLGIRTLAPTDLEFKPKYGDSHFERDMAYHQGTVWPFILGGYIRAYLKSEEYSNEAKAVARNLLIGSENSLNEYCLGQICEVLDGLNPSYSKGCYAQAWSISEIYLALIETEE
ncbi:amylo-alpha-1,6-glucosidase [Mollicutes bacterium LVI A0078]|nr:amylo-alpha-1,6-glucosidase [Mollicutes bacterium LVI A0075]WOO90361.1 amylo-alpha-1,6-glucosidase [Mollicutes bacterium LVI A0078]